MKVFINDEERTFAEQTSLSDLIHSLGFQANSGLAIAVNQQIIPATHWQDTILQNDDRVLMVTAIQGG